MHWHVKTATAFLPLILLICYVILRYIILYCIFMFKIDTLDYTEKVTNALFYVNNYYYCIWFLHHLLLGDASPLFILLAT